MRATLQSKRFLSFVAACVLLVVSGCSDSAGKACDGVDGLNAACRTCVDDLPQGPNESAEACAAFAEEFGCECALGHRRESLLRGARLRTATGLPDASVSGGWRVV